MHCLRQQNYQLHKPRLRGKGAQGCHVASTRELHNIHEMAFVHVLQQCVTYQLVCRGSQLVQQRLASGRLDDVQEAPEVAGVLQPSRLQEVIDGLCHTSWKLDMYVFLSFTSNTFVFPMGQVLSTSAENSSCYTKDIDCILSTH